MAWFSLRRRLCIEGVMPERALLKLKRANIPLFNVQKTDAKRMEFLVNEKDVKKVFAIYPKLCYNTITTAPFFVRDLGSVGLLKVIEKYKNRKGFLLGAILFALIGVYANGYVFAVDFVGSSVYAREAYALLEEKGITPFATYKSGEEDWICAQLLRLPDVEYASVCKRGMRVQVEMRLYSLPAKPLQKGDFVASHSGEILSITALRGTVNKKAGDKITAGEPLVFGYYLDKDGGQVCAEPIARASIACTYEAEISAKSEEEAFATAYLQLGLGQEGVLHQKSIQKTENGFWVQLQYTAVEKINL